MADAHNDDSGAPPVTICCAASDGAAVREAAEALVARGHQVELALGVDADTAVLTRAIARLRGRGLYVLCRSHSLDRNAVDLLREILRTHDVPFGRTLTLAVDTQRPREVEERIVSVLRRMVTGRADGRPKAWGTNTPTHEEDPDTTVRKPGGAMGVADPANVLVGLGDEPENADPYASTSQIEVQFLEGGEAVPAVPYTGVERTAVGPAPQAPVGSSMPGLPSMPIAAVPIAVPVAPTRPLMPMGGGASSTSEPMPLPPMPMPPMPMPMPMPSASSGPMASASTSGPLASGPMPSASVSMPVPPLFSPGMPPMSSSPAMSDALTAYTPPPVSADDSSDFDELTTGGRMGRALGSPAGLALIFGGLAVVVLAVVAAFMLGRDDEGDAQAAAATADDAASKATEAKRKAESPAKDEAAKGGTEKADGDAKADDDAKADGADADAKADDAKVDDAKADDAKTDAKADDAKADDAKADDAKADAKAPEAEIPEAEPEPTPEAEPEPTPEAEPEPAPDLTSPSGRPRWAAAADPGDPLPSRTFAPQDDPPEVVAALRSREVRALDVFLVAPERKGTLTYDQAVTYCQTLEVAKLTGWRVPTIGELNAVATAKMLGKAIFWSMTPGDSFGDLRLVLGTKKATTIVAVPKGWDGAKIVCIRPRQP